MISLKPLHLLFFNGIIISTLDCAISSEGDGDDCVADCDAVVDE